MARLNICENNHIRIQEADLMKCLLDETTIKTDKGILEIIGAKMIGGYTEYTLHYFEDEPNRIYIHAADKNRKKVVTKPEKITLDDIMAAGNEILDELFGDIFGEIEKEFPKTDEYETVQTPFGPIRRKKQK